jgi:hypothetical protein
MMNTLVMIVMSLVAGLLSTMNVWVDDLSDMRLHFNDFYMAILMTSWMLFFMSIYDNSTSYVMLSIILITVTIYAIKTQAMIDDQQFIKGMIPHHSMAVLMAKRIRDKTDNNNIKALAENIIKTQQEEIIQMKRLEIT